ncbi:MAG: glucose-6-phosphate dehydrogenase, partial [Candidatus Andersenbacteria bacterium]
MTKTTISPLTAPTSFVIFGATGDLAQRKLLPALFNLFTAGYLPKTFRIIGVARDHLSTAEWRRFVEGIITAAGQQISAEKLTEFLTTLTYQEGLFEDGQSYLRLSEELIRIENKEFGKCSNKLFYLAVSPLYYSTIFTNLAHSGLTIPCGGDDGWTRILVEKPFGRDLDTAQELDRTLGLLFKEEQIFRIDHYLAKETLQNILAFRFSNSLFEPLWNSTYIDKVEIKVWEELGVGTRGAFYEDVGALRDVGQNHMLQMLALIAMEDPGVVTAAAIRRARAKVLTALVPLGAHEVAHDTVRAQYQGYREEQNVATLSNTETFFRIKAHITNERWEGVPFYLESGKKMEENLVTISIFFKERASCLIEPNDDQRY